VRLFKISKLAAMKEGPAFTLSGDIITETKTGSTGRVVKAFGNNPGPFQSVKVDQVEYKGKPGKEQVLYSRMANWYFYSGSKTETK
jgi:hypothetical protein